MVAWHPLQITSDAAAIRYIYEPIFLCGVHFLHSVTQSSFLEIQHEIIHALLSPEPSNHNLPPRDEFKSHVFLGFVVVIQRSAYLMIVFCWAAGVSFSLKIRH